MLDGIICLDLLKDRDVAAEITEKGRAHHVKKAGLDSDDPPALTRGARSFSYRRLSAHLNFKCVNS